jgi:hypothetical protein
MIEDPNTMIWILGGIAAAGSSIAAYLNGRISSTKESLDGKIAKTSDLGQENQVDIARLRAHVSENYSTKNEVQIVRTDTQHSLDRIHLRLDELMKAVKGSR